MMPIGFTDENKDRFLADLAKLAQGDSQQGRRKRLRSDKVNWTGQFKRDYRREANGASIVQRWILSFSR